MEIDGDGLKQQFETKLYHRIYLDFHLVQVIQPLPRGAHIPSKLRRAMSCERWRQAIQPAVQYLDYSWGLDQPA